MSEFGFTKDNLDQYLKELSKEYRKRSGKIMPAEIILIGGASVVINYGFREMTYDMDAIIEATSTMKEAINSVGDKYDLPNGWINTDFMKTSSYTPEIRICSKYYKTFSNIVTFRTVTGEYLIAMKLMAGRQYKYDLSDVIGILWEQAKAGKPMTLDLIKEAVVNLYGNYNNLPERSRVFVENALDIADYESLYRQVRQMEKENEDILVQFQKDYPKATNKDNVNEIIAAIREKNDRKP